MTFDLLQRSLALWFLLLRSAYSQDPGCIAPINTGKCIRPSGAEGVYVCKEVPPEGEVDAKRKNMCVKQSQTLGISSSPVYSCGCCNGNCPELLSCGCPCDLPPQFTAIADVSKQGREGGGDGVWVAYERNEERFEYCIPPSLADASFTCVDSCLSTPADTSSSFSIVITPPSTIPPTAASMINSTDSGDNIAMANGTYASWNMTGGNHTLAAGNQTMDEIMMNATSMPNTAQPPQKGGIRRREDDPFN